MTMAKKVRVVFLPRFMWSIKQSDRCGSNWSHSEMAMVMKWWSKPQFLKSISMSRLPMNREFLKCRQRQGF